VSAVPIDKPDAALGARSNFKRGILAAGQDVLKQAFVVEFGRFQCLALKKVKRGTPQSPRDIWRTRRVRASVIGLDVCSRVA